MVNRHYRFGRIGLLAAFIFQPTIFFSIPRPSGYNGISGQHAVFIVIFLDNNGFVVEGMVAMQTLKLARSNRGTLVADLGDMTQDEWESALAEKMGVAHPLLSKSLLRQYLGALGLSRASPLEEVNAALQALTANQPKDLPELLLITQMLATNKAAMDLVSNAHNLSYPDTKNAYLGLATRLLRLSTQQLEALARYRRNGKQEIRIEKVIMDGNSQAVFGIAQGGR